MDNNWEISADDSSQAHDELMIQMLYIAAIIDANASA